VLKSARAKKAKTGKCNSKWKRACPGAALDAGYIENSSIVFLLIEAELCQKTRAVAPRDPKLPDDLTLPSFEETEPWRFTAPVSYLQPPAPGSGLATKRQPSSVAGVKM
jgi:hypothetical protein